MRKRIWRPPYKFSFILTPVGAPALLKCFQRILCVIKIFQFLTAAAHINITYRVNSNKPLSPTLPVKTIGTKHKLQRIRHYLEFFFVSCMHKLAVII